MPKSPILRRDIFYDTLNDGSLRELDLAVVNTSLGMCVELRSNCRVADKIANVDIVDAGFNSITQLDEDTFFRLYGVGGRTRPIDFNY